MGIKIGIIGGSGLDNLNIFTNARDTFAGTVWGEPSSPLREGEIAGVPVIVLARHGRSHTIAPSSVNYRANIQALKDAGCTHILATTATGSLREEIRRGDLVILESIHRLYQTAENDVPRLFRTGPARPYAHGRTI